MQTFVWNPDPVALSLGPLTIYWYGILFAGALLWGMAAMHYIFKREGLDREGLDLLFMYMATGIVVGARLGHCLFYEPQYYLSHPLKILAVWEGGLASHGGALGALLAAWLWQRRGELSFPELLDRLAVVTGGCAVSIRLGNFMNSEIIGHPFAGPWAVVFQRVDALPRHPVQLYEALTYLVILGIMVWAYIATRAVKYPGRLFGLFLVLVFSVRVVLELFKLPQATYALWGGLHTGQWLSLPFILLGAVMWARSKKK